MADFKIKKGYTVPISGEASKVIEKLSHPPFVGMCPVGFPGLKPKLSVALNDQVKVGSPLFFDKKRPEIVFLAPASGRVTAINYGPRRVIEEIVIATDETYEYASFEKYSRDDVAQLEREALVARLQTGGLWPLLRRRPFNKIASSDEAPKGIFVNCMDTAPLANDPCFSLAEDGEAFAVGATALRVLCDRVHVCVADGADNAAFAGGGADVHSFSGKHPAGLTGTHIACLDPINKGEVVWYLNARDVVMIGQSLLGGRYPVDRVVAVAGPGVVGPKYFRGQIGMNIRDIVGDNVAAGEQRFVSGNVLTGTAKTVEGYLGFYDDLVTVLPEGREQRFLGWMAPVGSRPSFTRAFLAGLFGNKKYAMDTNINGGHRAIIQSGLWDRVVALDVFPEFLVKATMAGDVDQMEQLGILECDPEDFALCTYIDPSKTEVGEIIANGLDLMEKEG